MRCLTFRPYTPLPWRPGVGHVISDIVTHDRTPSLLDPRAVLRRVLNVSLGWGTPPRSASSSSSICSKPTGRPIQNDIHAYSLENANALDPLIGDLNQVLGRLHPTGGHSNRVRTRPGRNQPGVHRRVGRRRRQCPAEVCGQGGGSPTRQARQLHAQTVLGTLGKLCAPAYFTVARR